MDENDRPVELDDHRGMLAQVATEARRRQARQVQAAQIALQMRQQEFEDQLLAAPAETWPEAAAKAQYLIQLYAAMPEAQDPRRKQLITRALDDFARLSGQDGDTQ